MIPQLQLFIITLYLLICWHALADFPLQGQYLSDAKSPATNVGKQAWKWALPYHAMIHSLGVYLITGSFILALVEIVLHMRIDYLKCMNRLTLNQDQAMHVFCKVIYAIVMVLWLPNHPHPFGFL
jgi:hypothetical protein